jgi:tRNA(Arg) A34 adenosine deaminase TadA
MDQLEGVEAETAKYLDRTRDTYRRGQDTYYARLALEQALLAAREGNYGIGAVAVFANATTTREYRARSAMVTGAGIVDHAETRALLAATTTAVPDDEYPADPNTRLGKLREGLSVYGTLEPCPMCACALTNAGAVRSISNADDGQMVSENGLHTSDGAASVLGRKYALQPRVWREIQQQLGLKFERLSTNDQELTSLSWRLFAASRDSIDSWLGRSRSNRPSAPG